MGYNVVFPAAPSQESESAMEQVVVIEYTVVEIQIYIA